MNREVRQGGTIVVPVPGATADQLPTVTSGSPEVLAKARVEGNAVVVDLTAQHGAALGDVPEHKVTIAAKIGGYDYERKFSVLVQAIAASPTGRDTNPGSESQPFRTFRQAASVAGWGDTILLRNNGNAPSEPNERDVIIVPAGVTVRGLVVPQAQSEEEKELAAASAKSAMPPPTKYEPTQLNMPLELAGRATLENLAIDNRVALETTDANANVTLSYTSIAGGLSVAASATQAMIFITGNTKITRNSKFVTDDQLTTSPIVVRADGATLSIAGDADIEFGDVTTPALVPLIDMTGARQHLIVHDRVRIHSEINPVAIRIADAETVEIEGARFLGRVELSGTATRVTVKDADFAPGYNSSGIVFKAQGASSMHVVHTNFTDDGISIRGLQSKVTIRRSTFRNFRLRGILLNAGTLDLGTAGDPGVNEFIPGPRASSSDPLAVGLEIDAEPGTAKVTVSGTKFNEVESAPCTITGPIVNAGFWKISDGSEIVFE